MPNDNDKKPKRKYTDEQIDEILENSRKITEAHERAEEEERKIRKEEERAYEENQKHYRENGIGYLIMMGVAAFLIWQVTKCSANKVKTWWKSDHETPIENTDPNNFPKAAPPSAEIPSEDGDAPKTFFVESELQAANQNKETLAGPLRQQQTR